MTAAAINKPVRGNITQGRDKILNKPRAFVYRSLSHNVGSGGAATPIQWDTMVRDTDGMWNAAGGITITPRLTCRTAGTYKVTGWVLWPASAASFRELWIMKNGALTFTSIIQPSTVPAVTTQEITRDVEMDAGDYVELGAAQNTGGTLTLPVTGTASTYDHGFQACLISTS